MAEEIRLDVQPRTVKGKKVNQLRRRGIIPLTIYGGHIEAAMLQAEDRILRSVLAKAGHNRLIRLSDGNGASRIVVAREIQREPITGKLLHVDLQEISLTEKMTTDVPIVLQGTPPIVSLGEGLLLHGLDTVSIKVLPTDLIPEIEVDVSGLTELNQTIHVSDLKVSDKIEILTAPDEMIAKIIAVKEEVITEEVPVATAEVEVIGKGKAEEEGEGNEEGAAAEQPEGKKEEKK